MTKYRIGIVGFGKIARDQHAPAIAASEDFELAAVSNLGPGDPPSGIPAFAGVADMLGSVANLDAVTLCTPPGRRRAIAIECLAAGKHVLLEKPPAATISEVSDIAAHASAAGKAAFATYHAQHNDAVKKAAALLVGKTISSLQVTWKENIHKWHPGQDWILAEGGFGIFDPGINAFSILTRIMPQPLFVASADLMVPANRQAPIAAHLTFNCGSAESSQLVADFDWRHGDQETWEIRVTTGDGVSLLLSKGGCRLEVAAQPPFETVSNEYPDVYRDFAALIRSGKSTVDSAPFQLVADAFMIGRRTPVGPFAF